VGGAEDRFVWAGEAGDVRFETTLWLYPAQAVWFWQVALLSRAPVPCDVILVQDLGLGDRGFLMNNEAFASQYTDHHVARLPDIGTVLMSRQNLAQGDLHPWAMHGCLDGAAAFATDALQLFGPGFRDAATIALPFGTDLPSLRLQHECACAILQSRPVALEAGSTQTVRFFGLFEPDHPGASGEADLGRLDLVNRAAADFRPVPVRLQPAVRSLLQDAAPVVARPLAGEALARAFPQRSHEEYGAGEHEDGGHGDRRLLSFFAPDGPHNRHVVLKEKERLVPRRHGTLLRSGSAMLPDEATLCATAWMPGVFTAQLTIGNTSFHKLFSVSRDPYNIVRASGLRILA
jgi:cellobiose phosphorylase